MIRILVISAVVAEIYSKVILMAPLLDGRIVGGEGTTIENHPYQVSLRHRNFHICGGSIIKADVVLSAAHCINTSLRPSTYSVQHGVAQLSLLKNVIPVKYTLRHEKYSEESVDYDVGLVKLLFKIWFTKYAKPISLVTTSPVEGTKATVTGWGSLSEGGALAKGLQQVYVTIISRILCKNQYKDINAITDRMLCAGASEGGKDSCQGDSGGPMIINGEQVGIISWGVGCARKGYAGVNSNIAVLQPWIKEHAGL